MTGTEIPNRETPGLTPEKRRASIVAEDKRHARALLCRARSKLRRAHTLGEGHQIRRRGAEPIRALAFGGEVEEATLPRNLVICETACLQARDDLGEALL